jgi:hypothetical protein
MDSVKYLMEIWKGVHRSQELYDLWKKCMEHKPTTVATQSKAWTVIARSNTGIVGSNSAWGMDVCVHLFCVYAVLCVGNGLATG